MVICQVAVVLHFAAAEHIRLTLLVLYSKAIWQRMDVASSTYDPLIASREHAVAVARSTLRAHASPRAENPDNIPDTVIICRTDEGRSMIL
ncbi:hypothetical protein B0T22DRAFT_240670 [Podospora appendiculata]|uniref:Uncharacterized protein n=1 Tax=Podospora appendiculata TaxID=314037 RepID=A0AAE1CAY6_9PEZI|nr:hypothetical protein B0T22DRAFT_240670 [Podospora appendiculata]